MAEGLQRARGDARGAAGAARDSRQGEEAPGGSHQDAAQTLGLRRSFSQGPNLSGTGPTRPTKGGEEVFAIDLDFFDFRVLMTVGMGLVGRVFLICHAELLCR